MGKEQSIYVGLTKANKMFVVISAVVIVLCALGYSVWSMQSTLSNIQIDGGDAEVILLVTDEVNDPLNRAILRTHVVDAVVNAKVIANKQATVIVSFAGAFALYAVGFALFLLGADGAFAVQAERGPDAKLTFAGTAPGLLCFFLGATIMVTGVLHRSKLDLGAVNYPSPSSGAALSAPTAEKPEYLQKLDELLPKVGTNPSGAVANEPQIKKAGQG
jgi:hypothetical protein